MEHDYKKYILNIRRELKNYIIKHDLKSLILGVSGGADSTLVALLAKPICDELGIKLIGNSISIETNKEDEKTRAKNIGSSQCSLFNEIDLTEAYQNLIPYIETMEGELTTAEKIRRGNIKARLRMIYLYNQASANKGIVLSTDNYTEYLLGFWTLHGDVADFGMIQELWKTEVYGMLEYIKDYEIIELSMKSHINDVINANATDGLGITNTDLDQLLPGWKGSSKDGYVEVDILLKDAFHNVYVLKRDFTASSTVYTSNIVMDRMINTDFKRKNPINIPRNTIIN